MDNGLPDCLREVNERFESLRVVGFHAEVLARNQHVVTAAPASNPSHRNAFAYGANKVLARCVSNVERALFDGKQNRRAVREILDVIREVIFLAGIGQCRAQCTQRADLNAMTNRIRREGGASH